MNCTTLKGRDSSSWELSCCPGRSGRVSRNIQLPKHWAWAARAARKEEQALAEQGEHNGEFFRWQRSGTGAATGAETQHSFTTS